MKIPINLTRTQYAEWLRRLRSGEYKQGKKLLRNGNDEYCCLGICGDILDPNGWLRTRNSYVLRLSDSAYYGQGLLASDAIPSVTQMTLAEMNDRGMPFTEIADWIEANLQPKEEDADFSFKLTLAPPEGQ